LESKSSVGYWMAGIERARKIRLERNKKNQKRKKKENKIQN